MERRREPVTYSWQGPFPIRELPDAVLYDVEVSFRHSGSPEAHKQLQRALDSLAGESRLRRLPFLGARVVAEGRSWHLTARLRDDEARVRVHHRVKGKGIERLVRSLAGVSDARDLKIEATKERYVRPYTSVGPCSPCAAGRFGASR